MIPTLLHPKHLYIKIRQPSSSQQNPQSCSTEDLLNTLVGLLKKEKTAMLSEVNPSILKMRKLEISESTGEVRREFI